MVKSSCGHSSNYENLVESCSSAVNSSILAVKRETISCNPVILSLTKIIKLSSTISTLDTTNDWENNGEYPFEENVMLL